MSKLGSWVLLIIALLMISTVTIFGPEQITQDVLSKIVPERKTQQDTDVVARLTLDKPLLPGSDATVTIDHAADLAGNATKKPIVVSQIDSDDDVPPRLVSAGVASWGNKVTIVALFNEELRAQGVLPAGNYVLEVGSDLKRVKFADDVEVVYDADAQRRHMVRIDARAAVKPGEPFVLRIVSSSNILDLAGNKLQAPQSVRGKVAGPAAIASVTAAVQDLAADRTGKTVAVTFSERLDPASAADATHYRTTAGERAVSAKPISNGKTVLVGLPSCALPGETKLLINGLQDAAGLPVPFTPNVAIAAMDTQAPKAKALKIEAVSGSNNDVAVVTFDSNVLPADAADVAHYAIAVTTEPLKGASAEEQLGVEAGAIALAHAPTKANAAGVALASALAAKTESIDLSSSSVAYDEKTAAATVTISGVNLKPGDVCKLTVQGVRNVAGKPMAGAMTLEATVAGDTTPPAVAKALQDLSTDSTGATLLVRFDEAVDMETANTTAAYTLSGGIEAKMTRAKGDSAVYVLVSEPVIPGETTLTVEKVRDVAGNMLDASPDLPILAQEQNPPTVSRLRGLAIKGSANDQLTVAFSEPVVVKDAVDVANYKLESPAGTALPMAGATAAFDPLTNSVIITLAGVGDQAVNLKRGETVVARVQNVRDLGGNPVAAGTKLQSVVEGDSTPPGIRQAFLNKVVDKTGATVDIEFTEAVDPATVENLDNYTVVKGPALKSVKALGEGQGARLTFAKPVKASRGGAMFIFVAIGLLVAYFLGLMTKSIPSDMRRGARTVVAIAVVALLVASVVLKRESVQLRVYGVTDLAGNLARTMALPDVQLIEQEPPTVVDSKFVLPPQGSDLPAEVRLTFSESINPQDAVKLANYRLDTPPGQPRSLDAARIYYLAGEHLVRILVPAGEKGFQPGDPYILTASNLRDLAGNQATSLTAKGDVGGDLKPPTVVHAQHQWEELDLIDYREEVEDLVKIKGYGSKIRKGATVDIDFSEPLDVVAAQDASNYMVWGGAKCLSAMVDKDDPKKVWVSFSSTLVPGETKILLRNIKDQAGNVMPMKTDLMVAPEETEPPKVIRSQANAVSGVENDTIFVTFDEEVVAGDARNLANYTVESPKGQAISLAGCAISYNAPTSTTTITLTNGHNLTTRSTYLVTVQNVRDVSGNAIQANGKDNVIDGEVRGDRSKPMAKMVKVIQRLSLDPTGRVVDVQFEEAIDPAVTLKPKNFTISTGQKVLSVELASVEKMRDETLADAVNTVSVDRIRQHMERFSAMPAGAAKKSRLSGTLGNREAMEYVKAYFEKLGLKTRVEKFNVVVPIQDYARMTVDMPAGKQTIPLEAIWPNKVKTCSLPTEGLQGHLIDGNYGELADFNGYEIKGAIVLMKFGSRKNYFNARMLGASAVIFYDDGQVISDEAIEKFIELPADIPRFWIDKQRVPELLALARNKTRETPVTLEARVDWQTRETWNVYALYEGADEFMPERGDEEPRKWKDQVLVLEAYYDSISVVPTLAPGADSTSGIAALLETARFLTQAYPPKFSIVFLATSGHFQGLSGVNNFVYRHVRKSEYYLKRMAVDDKIDYLFYRDVVTKLNERQIEKLEDEEVLNVALATDKDVEQGHAVHLWGDQYARLDDKGQVVVDPDGKGEIRKQNMRLFVGLDLSSHNNQMASFAEGTFYNYGWRTDNYKQNAIAPFAKKFFEYYEEAFPPDATWAAKAKTRNIAYLETRGYINAVTPSKRSWRHYMTVPLALDHEAVTWVGYFGLSMATPKDMRIYVDTPNDVMGNVNVDNVYAQARTLAALMGQAGRDDKFIPDSKLELKDMGHNMKGNVVWFDRNVNFFVPKAPLGGAIMTYQVSGDRARSGVRTLMTAMTANGSPSGGDEHRGYKVETITADTTRVRVLAWNRKAKNPTHKRVVVKTRYGRFEYALKPSKDDPTIYTSGPIDLTRRVHDLIDLLPCGIVCGVIALICLGLVYFVKDIPRPARVICHATTVLVVLIFGLWTAKVVYTKANDPRMEPKQQDLNMAWDKALLTDLELGGDADYQMVDKPVDIGFNHYKGQFFFDVRRLRWTIWPMAYVLDDEGDIVFAPDRGNEGDKTYPIASHYGWWETNVLQVLFPCRALSVFDTVDSRYLTALDYSTILGPDDAGLQWWGNDSVLWQSRRQGRTVPVTVFYAKPGQRVKVLMSTGLLGVKYLLTNTPPELFEYKDRIKPANVAEPFGVFYDSIPRPKGEVAPFLSDRERKASIKLAARGRGYPIEDGIILNPAFKGTKDMWVIDDVRMKELAKYGVKNQKIEGLHERSRVALELAETYLKKKQYDRFMAASREAWGLEARGYPDVKATANDTVKGIVFYFILLLPFSYFAERLLFGFADVRRRLIAFGGVFVLVFLVLHSVHPAFKLSSSPYIIFLAFITFALGGAVLFMVMTKFNHEVQKIKRAASGIHEVDVGRLSATYAAINLGISNLRKRKVRTGLTAATLILLTFTVLSFTSVSTSLKYYKLPRDNRPTYQGALVRDRNWKGLQESVLDYLDSAFEGKATIVPRAWRLARIETEKEYIAFQKVGNETPSFANALVGFTEREKVATMLDRKLIGENSRWFKKGDFYHCILPSDMAALVGITEDDIAEKEEDCPKIRMLGSDFTVIGIIDSDRFNRTRDLDDEKLTPVDMVSEGQRMRSGQREDPDLQASEPIESFVHLESSNVMLVPFDYAMSVGGTVRSIAITQFKDPNIGKQVEDFMSRVALTVFVGEGDGVTVYSSIGATSLGGLANLAIPILIAALIVLNTMLGSVYERFREIGIFSSVGLAPVHIAALFLAEAAVFATVGAVMGYLVGQVTTMVLSGFGILEGMNLNYSSLSAISSTLVVMATVFLSTMYPAKKAASMAVPDVTRKWKFPEPEGDRWVFDFPFTIGGAEVVGMYAYLARIFESYGEGSTGGFVAENVKMTSGEHENGHKYTITMRTWLAPYALGISQDVTLDGLPTGEHNVYRVEVILQRLSGDVASWRRINRGFLNVLRKRFLVWRTVSPEEKIEYRETGLGMLESPEAAG